MTKEIDAAAKQDYVPPDATLATAVADLRKARTDLEARLARAPARSAAAKVKAARTKANKRPRAPVEERPTGRGFILS